MRSDAVRNREAIVTGAIRVLTASPHASMREIADASGIGRTTLYRHFPNRQALVAAIADRVIDDADALMLQALSDDRDADPVEVVAQLSADLASLGDRYRFVEHFIDETTLDDPSVNLRRVTPLGTYLAAAQKRARIRSDLEPQWLLQALVALISLAARQPQDRTAPTHVMLRETVRSILTAPSI